MKTKNIYILVFLFSITTIFAQSTVYRDNTDNSLEDKLSEGIDKIENNNRYWFVYSVNIADGPQIHRHNSIHYTTTNHFDREEYRVENVIRLSDLPGTEAVAKLENKSFDRTTESSKYYLIFEYSKGEFEDFHISNDTDGFDFSGKEIIFAGNTIIEESYGFSKDLLEETDDDELEEDMVFAIYLHKELDETVTYLKELALDMDNQETAEQAIFWVGNIDKKETPQFLMDIYNDVEIEDLKEKAIFALSINETEEATDFLINIAMNDDDKDMRKQALFWIGQKASKKVLSTLKDVVEKDDDVDVKKSAVFALSQMETEEATKTLMDIAQNNPHKKVRKAAIFWLSQSDDPRATEFLVNIVRE